MAIYNQLNGVESSTWPTTGDIDTETNSLTLSVVALGHDPSVSSPLVGDAWLAAWNLFVDDFNQWKDAAWFWNPTRRDQLISYRARFNDLLSQLQNISGEASPIAPVQGSRKEPDSIDKLVDAAKFIGVLVGLGLVVKAMTMFDFSGKK